MRRVRCSIPPLSAKRNRITVSTKDEIPTPANEFSAAAPPTLLGCERYLAGAFRRGTEYVVVPTSLRMVSGREAVEATHPTTGDQITLYLDELDSFEVVK